MSRAGELLRQQAGSFVGTVLYVLQQYNSSNTRLAKICLSLIETMLQLDVDYQACHPSNEILGIKYYFLNDPNLSSLELLQECADSQVREYSSRLIEKYFELSD